MLDDADLALVDELSETDIVNQLADVLPADQLAGAARCASSTSATTRRSRATSQCSEAVVRKRVSRALHTLRARAGGTG